MLNLAGPPAFTELLELELDLDTTGRAIRM